MFYIETLKLYDSSLKKFIALFASGGVSNPRILLYKISTTLYIQYRVSGQSDVLMLKTDMNFSTTNKICFTINNNTLKLFVNGVLSGSATIVQGDPIEDLDLVENVNDIGHFISQIITFSTALTDAECTTLTTV